MFLLSASDGRMWIGGYNGEYRIEYLILHLTLSPKSGIICKKISAKLYTHIFLRYGWAEYVYCVHIRHT